MSNLLDYLPEVAYTSAGVANLTSTDVTTALGYTPSVGGTVFSVDGSGGTTGLTLNGGPIINTGTLTIGGTLIAANGGTGHNTYVVGDLLVGGATNTLDVIADVATGSVLISGGVGVAPTWSSTPTFVGTNITGTATGLSIGGNALTATSATSAGSATTAGTVTTAAQPAITSVGTLSALTVATAIVADITGNAGTATSATSAGSATTAGTATNIAGGSAGVVPYQSNAGTTTFTGVGTAGQVLTSNGTSAPAWAAAPGANAIVFKGVWDASTNNPTLADGVGTVGWEYIVNVAGSGAVTLNGISAWAVNDVLIYDGSVWRTIVATATTTITGTTNQIVASSPTGNITLSLANPINVNTSGTAAGLSSTLAATSGGTGHATYVVGDLLIGGAGNTLDRLADAAVGAVLVSGGIGAVPGWSTVPTFVGTNISGTATGLSIGGNAATATTAGTVTTAAQPNITSVGTLTGLTVSATIVGSITGHAATATSTTNLNGGTCTFADTSTLSTGVDHVYSTVGVTSATHTITALEDYVGVNYAGAVALTLNTVNNKRVTITITPSTGQVEGQASVTISVNGMALTLVCRAGNWFII
jgi:hypothetical protein